MANSASAMPGATTASQEFCCAGDVEEAVHDPPDGAEQADERRDRADRGEEVEPLGEPVDLRRHRRASPPPAASGCPRGRPCGRRSSGAIRRSRRRAPWRWAARSRPRALVEGVDIAGLPEFALEPLVVAGERGACCSHWPTMIAQVQMLARTSPTITALTTMSAWRNRATGDMRRPHRQIVTPLLPSQPLETSRPSRAAGAGAGRRPGRRPSPWRRPAFSVPRMTR